MSDGTLIRLQLKRGQQSDFNINTYTDYKLDYGEPFYDYTTKKLYIGDGVTALAYLTPINLNIDASYIADTINSSPASVAINGNKISGTVSTANQLQGTNRTWTADQLLANAGINNITVTTVTPEDTRIVNNVSINEMSPTTLIVNKGFSAIDLNGHYVNVAHTPQDIGGISAGTDISNWTLVQIIQGIFSSQYIAPTDFTCEVDRVETETTVSSSSIIPRFTLGSRRITSFKVGTTLGGSDLINSDSVESGTQYSFSHTVSDQNSYTIYASINDGTSTLQWQETVNKSLYNWYWGLLPQGISRENENVIASHILNLDNYAPASKPVSNIQRLDFGDISAPNCHACFAYPATLGKLTNAYTGQQPIGNGITNWTDNDESTDPLTIALTVDGVTVNYYVYVQWYTLSDTNYYCNFVW